MSRILVVEDDELLNGGICFNLQKNGHEPVPVYDLCGAWSALKDQDIDLILVGGGSIILPTQLAGAKSVMKPEHFGIANAIGSAISKVSGTFEQLISYDEIPREQALEQAKADAIDLAVAAGALRETVEIIEAEDVPLQYYAGNTNKVKIKAAGELKK